MMLQKKTERLIDPEFAGVKITYIGLQHSSSRLLAGT
jgi:hypothetical protein